MLICLPLKILRTIWNKLELTITKIAASSLLPLACASAQGFFLTFVAVIRLFIPDSTPANFAAIFSILLQFRAVLTLRFIAHGGSLPLTDTLGGLWYKQDLHRSQYNLDILCQAWICNLHQIHLKLIIGRSIIFAIHLGISSSRHLRIKCPTRVMRKPSHVRL